MAFRESVQRASQKLWDAESPEQIREACATVANAIADELDIDSASEDVCSDSWLSYEDPAYANEGIESQDEVDANVKYAAISNEIVRLLEKRGHYELSNWIERMIEIYEYPFDFSLWYTATV